MKTCSKCKLEKEDTEFYRTSGKRCKPCHNAWCIEWGRRNPDKNRENARRWYHRKPENSEKSIINALEWQAKNPEKRKKNILRQQVKKYGLTLEQYQEMELRQEGKCAICGLKPNRRLAVDHNHETGKVRQLLCNNCNTIIGHCKESVEILQDTINYLNLYSPLTPQSIASPVND